MNKQYLALVAIGLALTACNRPATPVAQVPPPPRAVQQTPQPQPAEPTNPQLQPQVESQPPADDAPGIAVGKQAPAFTLKDQAGQERTLAEFTENGAVALVFYRSADW